MKYFVCIEYDRVISVLDYEPNVPSSVELVEITEDQYNQLNSGDYYFDVTKRVILSKDKSVINVARENEQRYGFLDSTDWQVLRHLREKALGLETTLSEDQYIALEQKRQETAKSIVR